MSKAITVKEIRREKFKTNLARVKRFLVLTDPEFDSLFIDGEPDGSLNGRTKIGEWELYIRIPRNGEDPEFFCPQNREVEKDLNLAYQDNKTILRS